MMKILKKLFNKLKEYGEHYRTLQRVNNGDLRITKKGKVKKNKR